MIPQNLVLLIAVFFVAPVFLSLTSLKSLYAVALASPKCGDVSAGPLKPITRHDHLREFVFGPLSALRFSNGHHAVVSMPEATAHVTIQPLLLEGLLPGTLWSNFKVLMAKEASTVRDSFRFVLVEPRSQKQLLKFSMAINTQRTLPLWGHGRVLEIRSLATSRILDWLEPRLLPADVIAALGPEERQNALDRGWPYKQGKVFYNDAQAPHFISVKATSGRRYFFSFISGELYGLSEMGDPLHDLNESELLRDEAREEFFNGLSKHPALQAAVSQKI